MGLISHESLTIWCNNYFAPTQRTEQALLREGIGEHRLMMNDSRQDGATGDAERALLDADIAFGAPDPETVMRAEKLRWIQLNSAGYTAYDRDDFRRALASRGAIMTNSSAVYDEPCAQHLLAMMLSLARGLPDSLEAQRSTRMWRMEDIRLNSRLLNGQTVVLLGFGAIAQRLVELLATFGMNIIGVRRRVSGNEPVRVVREADVDHYLPLADHVVNTLPANTGTANFIDARRLARLKPGAILYNIGRGTTVDQDALLRRLEDGQLAAAYLDVTDPEPLPPDHPLWAEPHCYITPHTAGGHADEKERQVNHFLENLHRYLNGAELVNRII